MINEEQYLKGNKNFLIRMYFYLSNGLAIVNEFRNLILGIFGIYLTFKLTNPWIMVAIFIFSVAILTPTGYFIIHHVSRVKEWLSTKFGSHYQIQNFDYTKGTYELLVEIKALLEVQQKLLLMSNYDDDIEEQGITGKMEL